MVAALLQVLHSGPQNERLQEPTTKQPNLSFFKKIFRKSGRFTTQWVRLDFNTLPAFGAPAVVSLPRKGHLITRLYLVVNYPVFPSLPQPTSWTNSVGHALIQEATLEIGGTRIERLDGQLMEVLDEFNTPMEKVSVVNRLIGRKDGGYIPGTTQPLTAPLVTATPLPFWFARGDPGVALPVDAIQADEIRIRFTFRPLSALITLLTLQHQLNLVNIDMNYLISLGLTLESNNDTFNNRYALQQELINKIKESPELSPPPDGAVEGSAFPAFPAFVPPAQLGDTYILAEYVYLDSPEANRFRIADISIPITQHYALPTTDTFTNPQVQIPLTIPNPVRDIFFYAQPYLAPAYNAHFLATRYLGGADPQVATPAWPDATGLNPLAPLPLKPAFYPDISGLEPITSIALIYEGRLTKFSTANPALFRSILPSLEQKKSPWVNRYYYNIPYGVQHGFNPGSYPTGEANFDKIQRRDLRLTFPRVSSTTVGSPRFWIHVWAETYNVLRIYGGRAGLLFGY